MSNNLTNKSAYITGGSKGIGYGIAKALISQGMKVAITSRSLNSAKKAADSLSKDPSKILALESNVTSLDSEARSIRATVDHFGGLDVLVANAGIGHFAPVDELSPEAWHETIETNLTGVFNSVKASIDALKQSKGYIITVGSLAGINFSENSAAYKPVSLGLWDFHKPSCSTSENTVSKSQPLCRARWLLISIITIPQTRMPGKYNRKI